MKLPRIVVAASLGLAALVSAPVNACSCPEGPETPFLDFASTAPLVVRGQVISVQARASKRHPPVMSLRVLEVLVGSHPGNRITVAGDVGADCWHSVNAFPVGSEWVLALDRVPRTASQAPLLVVPRCVESRLPVEDGAVMGSLELTAAGTIATESTTLEDLRRRLRSRISRVARGLTRRAADFASLRSLAADAHG